jgi:hypothetical protein
MDGLVGSLRSPGYDPGLEPVWCPVSAGYHLRHPRGWKSLGRRLDLESGG